MIARLLATLALVLTLSGAAQCRPAPPAQPLAVFIHGGGWTRGTARLGRFIEPFFRDNGFGFSSIDYPKPPQVTLRQTTQSVVDQVNKLAGTRGAVTLVGHSAGAELAAAAAFSPGLKVRVRCLILLDGLGYDLAQVLRDRPAFGDRLAMSPTQAAAVAPIELVRRSSQRPAIFMASGAQEMTDDAGRFAAAARRLGIRVTMTRYEAMPHPQFVRVFARSDEALPKEARRFIADNNGCR